MLLKDFAETIPAEEGPVFKRQSFGWARPHALLTRTWHTLEGTQIFAKPLVGKLLQLVSLGLRMRRCQELASCLLPVEVSKHAFSIQFELPKVITYSSARWSCLGQPTLRWCSLLVSCT